MSTTVGRAPPELGQRGPAVDDQNGVPVRPDSTPFSDAFAPRVARALLAPTLASPR